MEESKNEGRTRNKGHDYYEYLGFSSQSKFLVASLVFFAWNCLILFVVYKNDAWNLLLSDLLLCAKTAGYSLAALLLLTCLVNCVICLILHYQEKKTYRARSKWSVVIFFLFLSIVNVFPIAFIIDLSPSEHYAFAPLFLLLSNTMLYYFLFHAYRELQEEKKKLYVVSAVFKGRKPSDYLREKHKWVILSSLRPMFYYLFSFTLFTDLLYLDAKERGIVGHIFSIIVNGKNFGGIGLATSLGVTMSILYLIKKILDTFVRKFAFEHSINIKQETETQ